MQAVPQLHHAVACDFIMQVNFSIAGVAHYSHMVLKLQTKEWATLYFSEICYWSLH
jgi:hypothetical protein